MSKLVQMHCKRTDRTVWVHPDCLREYNFVWGQVSPDDQSGWFFFRDDLEEVRHV